MQVGDTITITNKAGMLKVHIVRELDGADVARCLGDDKIPNLERPRLEYHKGSFGKHLVTLCGNLSSTPFEMYLMYIDDYGDKPQYYLGVCHETEQDVFETVY